MVISFSVFKDFVSFRVFSFLFFVFSFSFVVFCEFWFTVYTVSILVRIIIKMFVVIIVILMEKVTWLEEWYLMIVFFRVFVSNFV